MTKQNGILFIKKVSSDGLLQISWKKLLRKFKIDKFKDIPQGRTMHTLYPVNHLITTTPERTLGLYFDSFRLQHQLLRNLKFYQLHFIWVLLHEKRYIVAKVSDYYFDDIQCFFSILYQYWLIYWEKTFNIIRILI